MAVCTCNVAGNFPYLAGLGIISASLRTNIETNIVGDNIIVYGPAYGDLAITAYAPLSSYLNCPGKAGVSFSWEKRIECDDTSQLIVHFIPRGNAKAYIEGDIDPNISVVPIATYNSFSASAAGGPTSVYYDVMHTDGYDFYYNGNPIRVSPSSGFNTTDVGFLNGILPNNSKLYLQSFSWEYTPPNVPQVSYSFLFNYIP